MAVKIAAVEETKLRVGAEAHYAAMKAKLQHTCKTARERIAAMAQRAELREREYRASSAAASAERERLQASLEAVKQQQAEARARIAGLEGDIHDLDRQFRAGEKARRAYLGDLESLRCELRGHKARAARGRAAEQRVSDLERELQATMKAVAEARFRTAPAEAPGNLGGA